MARMRAYKLAEELKLDKEEFLEKTRELGIELRGAMSSLDEEQVQLVRAQLGAAVTEERIEKRSASGAVIRRRRKVVAKPEPAPEPEAPPEPAPAPEVPAEVPPVAEVEPEPVAEEAPPEIPAPEVPEVEQPVAEPEPAVAEVTPLRPAPAEPRDRAQADESGRPAARRPVRRQHAEQVTLKEQEGLARTMLGNVQHRLEQRRMIVERQARELRRTRRGARVEARPQLAAPAGPRQKIIRASEEMSFTELASQTGVKVRDLVRRAQNLADDVDRDALLDLDTVTLIAEEIGYEVQRVTRDVEESVAAAEVSPEDLEPRPPVVTVMGHVDHGKTSLLDTIRRTDVVAGEAGGITQHIGAYKVKAGGSEITFLDTPGHAAFTQMRARGAQATDVVVLVVSADDGVMPQTVEAIDHARAAGVPIVVAINKIDRPEANPQRVKQALLEREIVPEEFGGDTICVEVSATKGTNVDKLLEMLALQAEVLELKARRKGSARGIVVEAKLDRGRGPMVTVLVQEGTLKRGDACVVGTIHGRVRTLANEDGIVLRAAGPSTPVQIVGLSGVPDAGQELVVVKNEREAKAIAEHRLAEQKRAAVIESAGPAVADDIFASLGESEERELRIVVKGDVGGTTEAVREAAEQLSTERVKLTVIHSGVGGITESDVMLASASNALILGFHVRPEPAARKTAEREGVEVRTFDVVYEILDELTALMGGLLPPKKVEHVTGHAEVRELFSIPRRGTVAGCFVPDGVIRRGDRVRVVRDGVPVYTGPIDSLRRFRDDVREVQSGLECGIHIENFDDVKVGDILECFVVEETPDVL